MNLSQEKDTNDDVNILKNDKVVNIKSNRDNSTLLTTSNKLSNRKHKDSVIELTKKSFKESFNESFNNIDSNIKINNKKQSDNSMIQRNSNNIKKEDSNQLNTLSMNLDKGLMNKLNED